jgi:hypothetical protein
MGFKLRSQQEPPKDRKTWDKEKNAAQKAYSDKHGSSSGGSDKEWNNQQNLIKSIDSKYSKSSK